MTKRTQSAAHTSLAPGPRTASDVAQSHPIAPRFNLPPVKGEYSIQSPVYCMEYGVCTVCSCFFEDGCGGGCLQYTVYICQLLRRPVSLLDTLYSAFLFLRHCIPTALHPSQPSIATAQHPEQSFIPNSRTRDTSVGYRRRYHCVVTFIRR